MNGVHFGVHQDQNFYKLDYQFSVKTRHVQSTKKRKYVKFLQYIKKKYRNCFCVLFWCKTFRYVMFVTCFWVIVAKKGCGLLDHGTLKSAVSQESELIKWADFFACWYKFRKANVNLIIIGWAWSKMGKTFRSYRTLKSDWSHIWFDQSRRLIQ